MCQFCKYDMDIEITISVLLKPRPAEIDLHTAKQYNNKMIMVHDGIYYYLILQCVFLLFICTFYVTQSLLLLLLLLWSHSTFRFLLENFEFLYNIRMLKDIIAISSINNVKYYGLI